MEKVRQVKQLFSDVMGPCPVPGCTDAKPAGHDDDWLTDQANHLISEHGWVVLHVGQHTVSDGDGNPWQRTTIVLGEPC